MKKLIGWSIGFTLLTMVALAVPPYVQGDTFTAANVVVTTDATLNTAGGTNAVLTESGVAKTSGSTETWTISNPGAGVCSISTDGQLISTISTGTAPLSVSSTTVVSNLNADLLDGQDSTAFATAASLSSYVLKAGDTMTGNMTFNTGVGTDAVMSEDGVSKSSASTETWACSNPGAGVCTITTDGQLQSTVSTGTAPLSVASTTVVTNLNADTLDGNDGTAFVLKTGSTMTGSLTMNTGGGTDTVLSEGGLDRSSGATETIAFQNSGAGRADVTLDGTLLLGSLTSDPTGANGLSYYNTTSSKFRCYEAGAWKNCDTAGAGSVDIGSSIPSGTPSRILFVGAGPALDEDANLTWDDTSKYLVVGGGTGGYPIHLIASTDSELTAAVSNTDGVGTSAKARFATINTSGYFTDIGVSGASFATSGAISANDSFLRSNAPAFKVVNTTGTVGLYPSGSSTYALQATSSEVSVPSGVNLVVGGGAGSHEISAAKSEDGDVVIGSYNTDGAGTSSRAVVLGLNTSGYFTEVGATGASFTTAGAQAANAGIVRSNTPTLRVINTTGSINFYPSGSSTSVLDMTSTQVSLPAGVAFVVTESMTFTKSTNSQLQLDVSNTDGAGTSAQATLRASQTSGYFTDIGVAGASFTTVGAIAASDSYARSNAPAFKIVNTNVYGSIGLFPSGSSTYSLSSTSSEVSIPSGVNLVVGGGAGTHEIHASKSENGDVAVGSTNNDGSGTSARAIVVASNTSGYFTEIGSVGASFTTSGPQSANDSVLRSNAPELKVINTTGGVSFYPGGSSIAVATMTSTQVAMPALANTGTCTLDGAATATCTATTFSGATCVCSDTDPSTNGVAAIACANSGGTLTATSSVANDASVIAYHCF